MQKNKLFKNFILFLMFSLIISVYIFDRKINNFDELWNFNFALNISEKLVPYRDFNILQTPLLPFISGLILKIIGEELLVTRFLGAVLSACIIFICYKILEELKVNSVFSIAILLGYIYIYKGYFTLDYNYFNLLLILLIIYREIKNIIKNNDTYMYNFIFDFTLGIMFGLSILTKQSTGLVVSFIGCGYRIFLVRSKKDFLTFIKTALTRLLGLSIPVLIFVIYLFINNAFKDFIDYAILGVNTFSNSIKYSSLINQEKIVAVSSIIIPLFLIIAFNYSIIKSNNIQSVLTFYSIASLIVAYPISDSIHFLIGAMPSFLFLTYIFYEVISKIYEQEKESNKETRIIVKSLNEIVVFVFIFISFYNGYKSFDKIYSDRSYQELDHFKGIEMDEIAVNEIKNVDEYIFHNIQGIVILDSYASIYTIPIDKYDRDFSLFLKGNLGSKGEEGVIENIKNFKDGYKLLIKKDQYPRNWQTPEKVISFVKSNYKKIDEIEIFDVYEVKK